jgi:hypothetical protein
LSPTPHRQLPPPVAPPARTFPVDRPQGQGLGLALMAVSVALAGVALAAGPGVAWLRATLGGMPDGVVQIGLGAIVLGVIVAFLWRRSRRPAPHVRVASGAIQASWWREPAAVAALELGAWHHPALGTSMGLVAHIRAGRHRLTLGGYQAVDRSGATTAAPVESVDCWLSADDFREVLAILHVPPPATSPAGPGAALTLPVTVNRVRKLSLMPVFSIGGLLVLGGVMFVVAGSAHERTPAAVMLAVGVAVCAVGFALARSPIALHAIVVDRGRLELHDARGRLLASAALEAVAVTRGVHHAVEAGRLPVLRLGVGTTRVEVGAWTHAGHGWPDRRMRMPRHLMSEMDLERLAAALGA